MASINMTTESASISQVLMWVLVLLLVFIALALLGRFVTNMKGDNKIYYSEKGAINLRIDKLPDLRIATKNCKDFKVTAYEKTMIISYANPFGDVKEFKCVLVGEPLKRGFELTLTEADFKKLCFHLKPGKLAVFKHKLVFNYGSVVKVKFNYLKKEV